MSRRFDGKLFLTLLIAWLLFGIGIHALHAYQVRRQADNLLALAAEAEADSDRVRAIECLSRYLVHAPEDTDALARCGILLAGVSPSPNLRCRAMVLLHEVLRREPGRHDIRRRLARMAVELRLFTDARDYLEVLQQAFPDDAEVELLLGRCDEAAGQYAKAAAWFRKAIQHDPHRIEAYEALADLTRRHVHDPAKALQVLADMVARNPKSSAAYLARARYFRQVGDLAETAAAVAHAQELDPEGADVLLASAELAEQQGDLAKARAAVERGIALHGNDSRFYATRARLDLRAGQRTAAIADLRRSLEQAPAQPEVLWTLAGLLLDSGERGEAHALLGQLRATGYRSLLLDFLEARLLSAEGHWLPASRILERIRPGLLTLVDVRQQVDLALAQCYQQMGLADQELAAYRRAVEADPAWIPAQLGLAQTLAAQGHPDQAIAIYRKALPRAPDARLPLARLLAARVAREPEARRDWHEVERLLDEAVRADPTSPDVALLRAEVQTARGQPAEAEQVLRIAYQQQPRQASLALALGLLAERRGQADEALRILEEARQQHPGNADVALALATATVRLKPSAAATLLRQLAEHPPGDAADQARLLAGLAVLYQQRGEAEQAEQLWQQVAHRRPEDLASRLALLDLALQRGDDAEARRQIEDIKLLEGDEGAVWRYGEAARLAFAARKGESRKRLAEARVLLTDAGRKRPGWAAVPRLRAEIAALEGNNEGALTNYLQALELGERSPAVAERVAQLLFERRRYAEAEEVIHKLEQQAVPTRDLRRLAAEAALRNHDPDRALALARQAVPDDAADYRDTLWLARMLVAADRPVEAEGAFYRAVRQDDRAADAWVALAQYLAQTRQKVKLAAAIQEAEEKVAPEQKLLVRAQCYEAAGDPAQAAEAYRAAVAARPHDTGVLRAAADFYLRQGQPRQAELLLRQLLVPGPGTPEATVAWARRGLALVLADQGTYAQARQALALLAENAQAQPRNPEDERTRAAVLATRLATRHEAIRLLEDLLRRSAPLPEELFLLAQLYEAAQDGPQALDAWQRLARMPGGDQPRYLAGFARYLLRHGEAQRARPYVEQVAQKEPGALATLELQARLLEKDSKAAEATDLLRKRASAVAADILPCAGLLEELGQTAAAEELFRTHAANTAQPTAVLPLVQFLGRHQRPGEALDLCQHAWATCPPEAVAAAAATALTTAKAGPAEWQRLAEQLEAARDRSPDNAALLFYLAHAREMQGDYKEVEALYRAFVERQPDSAPGLNNLAWLLALTGRSTEALGLIARALEQSGPDAYLLDTRGLAFLEAGRADRAVRDLEAALVQESTAARHFHLAQAHAAARNTPAAVAALRKALALGLKAEDLHPLERPAYQALTAKLGVR